MWHILLSRGHLRKLGKDVCEMYIRVYLPIKIHADIFCSH